jgi:P27 family predicted phage terminase small subunit
MPGRRPKPTAVKIREGNPGKRKLNTSEPKPRAGAPHMPWYLTPEAQEEWHRIAPELRAWGEFTRANATALGSYCMAFARWLEAEEIISQEGVVIKEPVLDLAGVLVGYKFRKNPACAAALASQKEMRLLLASFGLDPASRSRLRAGSGEEQPSALRALLKAREAARNEKRSPQAPESATVQ